MTSGEKVKLGHGAGGVLTRKLVDEVFMKHLKNEALLELSDSAVVGGPGTGRLAFTTDSYVVSPLFFPGGDIGRLSISGTINDLAVVGARPLFISAGFIIEEGIAFETLDKIAGSMAETARTAEVSVVAADTKVVERGKGDGLFINTAGIGTVVGPRLGPDRIQDGDAVVVSGTMGDHGAAIMLARKRDELRFETSIRSDCAPLHGMLLPLFEEFGEKVRWARDVTRGGLFTILNEAVNGLRLDIVVDEPGIPVDPEVGSVCELLGLDPFYLANEGKVALVVDPGVGEAIVDALRGKEHGRRAALIGRLRKGDGRVYVRTRAGGLRIADSMYEDPVPRIC